MKTFLRIIKYSKSYKLVVAIAFIASFFFGIFNSASLWIVSTLISTIMGTNNNVVSGINSSNTILYKIDYFFDSMINNSNMLIQLKLVCVCLLVTFFFKNIFYYINWVCVSMVELKIVRDIRNQLYSKVQKYPLSFFDKNKTGEIISIMLNDINWINVAFNKSFHVFFHESVSMLILILLLFSISAKLTMIVLLTVPISIFIIIKIGQSIRRKATRSSFKIASMSHIISEKISGIKIVKAFNMTLKEIDLFIENNLNFYNLQYNQKKLLGLTTPINDIIGVILAVLLLWYGGQQVLLFNTMSSEDFMRFIIFLFALLQPARKLGGSIAAVQTGIAGADRVFSFLDLEFSQKKYNDCKEKNNFRKNIIFKDVSFKYEEDGKQILNNINIEINKGEKIALVGKSGAGKTTFANLLLGFYPPNSGKIFIDDYDSKEIKTNSIRNLIGIVTQEPILFNDTIKNNISYGQETQDKALIKKAAESANIADYIDTLSNKFETMVGERGVNLSGGQKQRISIARAILKDTPILILDEATSSLDSESEIKVQKAIDNLVNNRTVIIIAHRLSTIKNADKIFVFDDGEIIEKGTHTELINFKGVYNKLYKLQYGKED